LTELRQNDGSGFFSLRVGPNLHTSLTVCYYRL